MPMLKANVKYAVQTLEPSAPPHKKTIITGIKTAFNRTGNNPPSKIFALSERKSLPTKYVPSAARRVTDEPKITSYKKKGDERFAKAHPIKRAGTASGKNNGRRVRASAGRICKMPWKDKLPKASVSAR